MIQMPPHSNLFDSSNNSQERINNNNNTSKHGLNTTTSTTTTFIPVPNNTYSSLVNTNNFIETNTITNSITNSLETPLPLLSSKTTFDFNNSFLEKELLLDVATSTNIQPNSQLSSFLEEEEEDEEIFSNSVSDIEYLETCIEQMDTQWTQQYELMNDIYDSLDANVSVIAQNNNNNKTNHQSDMNLNYNQSSINLNNYNIYNENSYINTNNLAATTSQINYAPIKEIKLEKFEPNNVLMYQNQVVNQDESNSSFSNSSTNLLVAKPTTKIIRKNGKLISEKHYGPIVVRPRKNPAPTLASGRKSKYARLTLDEEHRREIRRERNRKAAEKCKIKRNEIEDKLQIDLVNLEAEKTNIKRENEMLTLKKLRLEKIFEEHAKSCAPILTSYQTTNAQFSSNSTSSQSISSNYSQQNPTYFDTASYLNPVYNTYQTNPIYNQQQQLNLTSQGQQNLQNFQTTSTSSITSSTSNNNLSQPSLIGQRYQFDNLY